MKTRGVATVGLLLFLLATPAVPQEVKPYKEGPVTEVSYIKIKPGKFNDYMRHLSTQYKQLMEAQKKAGLIVSYAIYSTQARSPQDPDLILTVTYANMAALDRIDEAEAVAAKVVGNMAVQDKGFADRGSMREVLGSELVRELILK